jgi:xanthine dehydrogenase YagS FAD-binding subunit
MKSFEMIRPASVAEASAALKAIEGAKLLAGGTDLLGEMKDYLVTPSRLVNLKSVVGLKKIESDATGGLKIGALVTLTELAENTQVARNYPILAEAIAATAMPQIRNQATIGGNLCQRPRCWYYRDEHTLCLKKGGEKCYSVEGENQYHAIFGDGPCHIVHPSDPAPALVALGASVVISDSKRTRTVPLESFFAMPSISVMAENILQPDEIITHVLIPRMAAGTKSTYLKERERDSHDWALCSAAVTLQLSQSGSVGAARIVLGGVAPIPWRVQSAENHLLAKRVSPELIAEVARIALKDAKPMTHNAYKVPLAEAVLRRALARVV